MKSVYEFGQYRLEESTGSLKRRGHEIPLRKRLLELLLYMVKHQGQVMERDQLLTGVWLDAIVEESNLTVSIKELRRIFGNDDYIETVNKRGYRFMPEVKLLDTETTNETAQAPSHCALAPPGGALPLQSPLYIARDIDHDFFAALTRRDSLVLVKGARQAGKTSLLARGLNRVREAGSSVILTDFQQLSASAYESPEKLLLTLAETIADRLELPTQPHTKWNPFLSPSSNFERFLRREVLGDNQTLVWGLDEIDRLFAFPYASEIFGLFRSWHNLRALDPNEPWNRLTLALAYATEAHLFITDLNQSPFNVGTRLTLDDFTKAHVAELNERYQNPLRDADELAQFYEWLGGHPYLTQRGLYEMTTHQRPLDDLLQQAGRFEGVFSDHLNRLWLALERDAELRDALHQFMCEQQPLTAAHFYRLRSAGVLRGGTPSEAELRCTLYRNYLQNRFA